MTDNSSRSLLAAHNGEHSKFAPGRTHTKRTPVLVGIFGTALISSIVLSVAIVLLSNNDPVDTWAVRPNVLLSILSSIFILSLEVLVMLGVAVSWWRSFAQGSTLKRLHYAWQGSSPLYFVPAFLAGSDARKVAIAGLIIAIAKFAEGPLLQKSTGVQIQDVTRDIDMQIGLAQRIPDGLFGDQVRFNAKGLEQQQNWFFNLTITTEDKKGYKCPGNGTCRASVPGAGINYGCGIETQQLDMLSPDIEGTTVFETFMNMNYDYNPPMLFLTTRYLSAVDGSCRATLTTETCNIIPATVLIPIEIQDTVITVDYAQLLSRPPSIVSNYTSPGDTLSTDNTTKAGPLTSLSQGMGSIFQSSLQVRNTKDFIPSNTTSPNNHLWATMFLDTRRKDLPADTAQRCPLLFRPPTKYIIGSISEFLFVAAYENAPTTPQEFTATFTGSEIVFSSDFGALGAAVIIMILGVFAVLLLLWGWRDLERHVTLSPLETGKALGAPILGAASGEKEAAGILSTVGGERVAYAGEELIWEGGLFNPPARRNTTTYPEMRHDPPRDESMELESHAAVSHRRRKSSATTRPEERGFEHSLGVSTAQFGNPYDEPPIQQPQAPAPHPRHPNPISSSSPPIPHPYHSHSHSHSHHQLPQTHSHAIPRQRSGSLGHHSASTSPAPRIPSPMQVANLVPAPLVAAGGGGNGTRKDGFRRLTLIDEVDGGREGNWVGFE